SIFVIERFHYQPNQK
ncbi:TPA: erythromycin resistance leader peptide, partial [Streptococcus pyogenes]|nr:erythromycin resistance leader peptide [Streptococcus pyogenes]HES3404813.1 erythromycin resistance leader peptide [Streptococcus pyogenes]HES6808378.1 erythromycin resistance leader peptide [Streptococcus pyogenes]HES8055586.1 erythromycin resistance leader peptide [Streptococcus pyogenes]